MQRARNDYVRVEYLSVNKPIAWLCLAAASLALSGCGGGEPPEDAKAAAPAKMKGKKGEEDAANPWAKDEQQGSERAQPAKKAAKTKGTDEPEENPWAKEPAPGATPSEPAKKQPAKKKGMKGEEDAANPWAKPIPKPAAS